MDNIEGEYTIEKACTIVTNGKTITVKAGTDFNMAFADNTYTFTAKVYVALVGTTKYEDLNTAISEAAGATVTLLDHGTVQEACQINKNGFTLTVNGNFLALKNYKNKNGYYDVVAATKHDTFKIRGTFNSWGWDTKGDLYIITGTDLWVAADITFNTDGEFKFANSDWNNSWGAINNTAVTANTWQVVGGNNIKVQTAGTYNIIYDSIKGVYCITNTQYTDPVAKADNNVYTDITAAIDYAGTSKVITLFADATVSQQCIINKNNHNLTITGDFGETSKYGDGYAYVFPVSKWKIYGIGGWDDAHAITMFIEKSTAKNVSIARNVTLTNTTEFKFRNGGTWKGCYAAFKLSDAFPNKDSWYQINNEHNANIKATDANGSKYDIFFDHQNYKFYICLSSKKHDI